MERHPWVRRAEARRVLPATIEVVVEEHAPVLILALDRMWYVNAMGEPFKLATTEDLDYPVLMSILLIGSVMVVIGNLVADMLYAILDPRVRL